MVEIQYRLRCDRCKGWFLSHIDGQDIPMRKHVEELRTRASNRGWKRFRPSVREVNQDYCPNCVKAMQAEGKAKKGAAD